MFSNTKLQQHYIGVVVHTLRSLQSRSVELKLAFVLDRLVQVLSPVLQPGKRDDTIVIL